MFYGTFTGLFCLLALFSFVFGVKLLWGRGWVFAWLRGTVGLVFLCVCLAALFVIIDLFSYKKFIQEKPIATLSFEKLAEQKFNASLVILEEGKEQIVEIHGDQWQMDARVIRWLGIFRSISPRPGYRLDRLSGRYYSLDDERLKARSVYSLGESEYALDFWSWLQNNGRFFPWIDAVYGSAAYLPMVDGAIYQVSLSGTGLLATPINDIADQAVRAWR